MKCSENRVSRPTGHVIYCSCCCGINGWCESAMNSCFTPRLSGRCGNCSQKRKASASPYLNSRTGPASPVSTPFHFSSSSTANVSLAARAIHASFYNWLQEILSGAMPRKMHYQAEDKAYQEDPEQYLRYNSECRCGFSQPK